MQEGRYRNYRQKPGQGSAWQTSGRRKPGERSGQAKHSHTYSRSRPRPDRARGAGAGQADRARRKRPRKKKPWGWKQGLVLFLVVFLALVSYLFLTHPTFNVKYVRVEGNEVIPSWEILDQLGQVKTNIFRFKKKDAESRLDDLPGVRSVSIHRDLPNRLVVKVREAYYVGLFNQGDQVYNLDNMGVVERETDIDKAGRVEALKLTGPFKGVAPGQTLFEDERYIKFLNVLVRTKLASSIQEVDFHKRDNIAIIYKNMLVQFGPPDDVYDKLTSLSVAIKEIENKKIPAKKIILDEGKNPIIVND